MSKSILVIDTPKRCSMCEFLKEYNKDHYCSRLGENDVVDEYMQSTPKGKPNWCPLKEMPEKKKFNLTEGEFDTGKRYGYNDCIDEILKAEDIKHEK